MLSYSINQKKCTFCGGCASVCPAMAIIIRDSESTITSACTQCGNCLAFCPIYAVEKSAKDINREI